MLIDTLMPFAMYGLAAFFAMVGFKLYQPMLIGWLGELEIKGVLAGLDSSAYTAFHNVLLPIDEETTQIDHVLIVGSTCFVIETKAHAGWIFGKANAANWIQQFHKRAKFPFQNPLRQNHKHISAIKPLLEGLNIVGVVVFTRATFKSPRIEGVLYCKELKEFIQSKQVDKTFNNKPVIQSLQKAMITDKKEHRLHVRRLQDKYGGRFRIPVAKASLIISALLILYQFGVGFSSSSYTTTDDSVVATQVKHQLRVKVVKPMAEVNQGVKASSNISPPPRVNGFVKGKVILTSGNDFIMMRVGQRTNSGWTLEISDTKSAVFLHDSGRRVEVFLGGFENIE